ncbi:MAG: hypothetical protein HC920_18135 [Oscillatoriales cyanobacterium SM2_3_0]|nr:hypothetical protein [Oscillatoriales cyanobacterium SM2_3_0]
MAAFETSTIEVLTSGTTNSEVSNSEVLIFAVSTFEIEVGSEVPWELDTWD